MTFDVMTGSGRNPGLQKGRKTIFCGFWESGSVRKNINWPIFAKLEEFPDLKKFVVK